MISSNSTYFVYGVKQLYLSALFIRVMHNIIRTVVRISRNGPDA